MGAGIAGCCVHDQCPQTSLPVASPHSEAGLSLGVASLEQALLKQPCHPQRPLQSCQAGHGGTWFKDQAQPSSTLPGLLPPVWTLHKLLQHQQWQREGGGREKQRGALRNNWSQELTADLSQARHLRLGPCSLTTCFSPCPVPRMYTKHGRREIPSQT